MHPRSKRTFLYGTIVLIVVAALVLAGKERHADDSGVAVTPPTIAVGYRPPSDWQRGSAQDGDASFSYPPTFGGTYVHGQDWPPVLRIVPSGSFTCTEAGTPTLPAGQTTTETIDGTTYCVTRESEGAAGSTYTSYAYAFPYKGAIGIFTFTTRAVQCANYDEPQRAACTAEQSAFEIRDLVENMRKTVR